MYACEQLGLLLLAMGHVDEADEALREALALGRAARGDTHPLVLGTICHVARVCRRRGDAEGALAMHQQVLAGLAAIGHPKAADSASHVVELLSELGRADEAAAIRAEYGDPDKLLSHRAIDVS
jgi:ATP/maltotriose-dependent transcriptional regulator MalT